MSGDTRDETNVGDLARRLRAAARSDLPDGAAQRIADAAWRRGTDHRRSRGVFGHGRRRARRIAAAAGLVVAAGLATLLLPGAEPAFAVDGDPVQVWDGSAWEEAREIQPGSFVFVPEGVRTLRGRDGSRIEPLPGACFRLGLDVQDLRLRIEVLRGRTGVLGEALRLEVADVSVEPAESDGMRVDVDFGTGGGLRFAPPADPGSAEWSGTPLIRAAGHVRLLQRATGRSLSLQPAETATLVTVEEESPRHLALVEAWSAAVPERIAAGSFLVGLDLANDRFVTYCGGDFKCVTLPAVEQLAALQQVNEASLDSLAFLTEMRVRESETLTRRIAADAAPRRELSFEKDGTSVVVRILESGAAVLQRGSGAPRTFESVEALRAADPEAAAVFGRLLDD